MMAIINSLGEDITVIMTSAATRASIPVKLALGCAIAESRLNPYAERWGRLTAEAVAAIEAKDWAALGLIINRVLQVSPDISFGYGQQIVRYHALGNHTETVDNCLLVRAQTFADPAGNLVDMAHRLASYLRTASAKDLTPVDNDPFLGACAIYNHGHWPESDDPAKLAREWAGMKPNLDNYRAGLASAALILGAGEPSQPPAETGGGPMTIPEKITELQATSDRLGNNGAPYSPLIRTPGFDEGGNPVETCFQAFWFAEMNEYPTLDGGRDVTVRPYPTLTPEQLAQFQG